MIGEFLLSCILVAANAYFCSIVSGGLGGELVQWIEMAGYIGILALFILLSGYEKSFCNIFAIPKRQKAATLQELKKNNSAISYAMKATVFIGLFFLLMGTSFFYINFWNTQTLGSNLGTVILSLLYLLFIEQVLIVLKSKNKTQMIKLMGGGDVCKVNQRKDSKSICISISKAIFSIVLILIIACIVIKNETKNETEFNFGLLASWIDLPSALELFILSFALLAISGNSSNFWSSIKIAFKNQKISVTQKNLYVNAIQTLSSLILVTGLACTLIGFMTMLVYLENRSMLGYNVQVALIASFYAVVSCLILLPLETKICSLAEGDSQKMIADLLLFTAGTVLLTVLTMDWKKKDIVQKLQSSSLFCGGIITALQLIVLFSKFEGMLNDKILVEEYFTQLGFMMTVLVKFRPLLFGVLCKLALKPFVEKSERKEIDRARAVHTDFSKLSVREAEVARLAARGYSNSQIADELFISVETVKRHMATVFEKLGIDSRKELKL